MKNWSNALMAAMLLLAIGCREESPRPAQNEEDDCVTVRSVHNGEIVPGEFIVTYEPMSSVNGRAMSVTPTDLLTRNGIDAGNAASEFHGEQDGFVATLSADEVVALSHDGQVARIEPDRIMSICTCFEVMEPRLITWSVRSTGYGDGSGRTAWVIDTGIDLDHPDLNVDRVRSRAFVAGETSADDNNGHGTHVAGIIGALNNRIGLLGVASGANLISLKVLNQLGEGRLSDVIAAVTHVNSNGRLGDVVNMSLGGEGVSETLDREIRAVANRGIFFAIAAGNERERASTSSPARVNGTNIYTVSAVDSLDNFATFSNYGNDVVDVAAPGVRIVSTYSNGRYARLSGTSMAAPHVAGVLLLRGSNFNTNRTARNDPDGVADSVVGGN